MRAKCFSVCESAVPPRVSHVKSEVTSKVCWWYKKKMGKGGCEVKHRRRILAQKCCRRVQHSRNSQEMRRTEGGEKEEKRKQGIGKKQTGLHNILFKQTLNKNIAYKSREQSGTLKVKEQVDRAKGCDLRCTDVHLSDTHVTFEELWSLLGTKTTNSFYFNHKFGFKLILD